MPGMLVYDVIISRLPVLYSSGFRIEFLNSTQRPNNAIFEVKNRGYVIDSVQKKRKIFYSRIFEHPTLIHTYLLFFQVRSNNLENSCNKQIFSIHHTLKIYWELMTSKSKTNSSLLIIFSDRSGITIEINPRNGWRSQI